MIRCKNGHENPDGATYCSVCQVYIDATAQPVEPVQEPAEPAVLSLSLSQASLAVVPGGEVAFELRLEQSGGSPDEYTLEVTGQPAIWASLDPPALALVPDTPAGARLSVRPPADAAAAVLPFEVVAVSRQQPEIRGSAQGRLEIVVAAPAAALTAQLEPQTSKGRTVGEHVLSVRNAGSAAAAVEPTLSDPQASLSLTLEPSALSLAAGAQSAARLQVRPRQPLWLGRARAHPFRIDVTPEVAVEGAMVQQARIPAWLALVVPLALAVVLALVLWDGDGRSYSDEVLADGPIAYWRLNEPVGTTTANDRSGNGGDGTYNGVGLGAKGALLAKPDSAAWFNGAAAWVDIPDFSLPGDFTLEAWVRLSGAIGNEDAIVGQEGPGQDVNFYDRRLRIFQAECEPGQSVIPGEPCWDVLVSAVPAKHAWTYWVITRSGDTLRLYKDGQLAQAGAIPWAKPFTPKAIGRGNAGFLRGYLDEVAIYARALDASRVQAHYAAR